MVYVTVQEGNKKSQIGKKTLRMAPLKTSWKRKGKRVSGWSFRKECLMSVKVAGRGVLAKTGVLRRSKYVRDMTNE